MTMQKIIHICPTYVDLHNDRGGVANVVRHLALNLAEQGCSVHLVCGNRELGKKVAEPFSGWLNERIYIDVIEQPKNILIAPKKYLRECLGKYARSKNCVAHVHTCFSGFAEYSMSILQSLKIPYVFTPHGKLSASMMSNKGLAKRAYYKFVTKKNVERSSCIGLMAEGEDSIGVSGFSGKVAVIPNGYDEKVLSCGDRDSKKKAKTIMYFGYLDPRKQPELLLRAFLMSRSVNDHKLLFVGPDKYGIKSGLISEINRLGVERRVSFIDSVYGAEKNKVFSGATVLCLPSKGEGHPIVLCEAIGTCTPVVYSKQCNFDDIEINGAGIMIDAYDEAAWSAAIDAILLGDDYDSYYNGCKKIREIYSWLSVSKKWAELYREVI